MAFFNNCIGEKLNSNILYSFYNLRRNLFDGSELARSKKNDNSIMCIM